MHVMVLGGINKILIFISMILVYIYICVYPSMYIHLYVIFEKYE